MKFAHDIFGKHPGWWQVRQIEGATNAHKFWQRIIAVYTNCDFTEEVVDDPDWGVVNKQTFLANKK